MDLRDLAYFETIAELGHLGQAADKLGRTKPALTKCVRRLEATLGVKLFQREGRGITITPAGSILLTQARRLRATSEEALRDMANFVQGVTGKVRVGTGPTVAEFLMPDICRQLLTKIPGVQVELMVGLGDIVRKALREDRLDVVVSTVLPNDSSEFDVDNFTADTVVVVAHADSPLCHGPVQIEDMLNYKWILSSPTAATRQWLDWAFTIRNHHPPEVQIESNSLQALPGLIAQSQLLGFVPRTYLHTGQARSGIREVQCDATTMSRLIGILRRRGGYLSPAAAHFYAMLVKSRLTAPPVPPVA
jgi:DNA-binding transcriptional LysR family regulator